LEPLEWSSWVWRGNRMSEALLKEESVKGEHVEWEELKREHSL